MFLLVDFSFGMSGNFKKKNFFTKIISDQTFGNFHVRLATKPLKPWKKCLSLLISLLFFYKKTQIKINSFKNYKPGYFNLTVSEKPVKFRVVNLKWYLYQCRVIWNYSYSPFNLPFPLMQKNPTPFIWHFCRFWNPFHVFSIYNLQERGKDLIYDIFNL